LNTNHFRPTPNMFLQPFPNCFHFLQTNPSWVTLTPWRLNQVSRWVCESRVDGKANGWWRKYDLHNIVKPMSQSQPLHLFTTLKLLHMQYNMLHNYQINRFVGPTHLALTRMNRTETEPTQRTKNRANRVGNRFDMGLHIELRWWIMPLRYWIVQ
jgi:hypothetical protein